MDRCSECGFDYELAEAPAAGQEIVVGVSQLAALLRDHPTDLSRRTRADLWSPLEYGCHVKDVLLVEHDGYAHQDPGAVARQVTDAAALLANVLSRLEPENWDRLVEYGYPARLERSLRRVAVHTVHEVGHHLLDVGGQLAAQGDSPEGA